MVAPDAQHPIFKVKSTIIKELLPEGERRIARVLLEESVEVVRRLEPQAIRHVGDRHIRVAEQRLGLDGKPFADVGSCRLAGNLADHVVQMVHMHGKIIGVIAGPS